MNKEEFIELIEGFEDIPFVIMSGGKATAPLIYVKSLSDSVKVMSNGKPAIYKYSAIESLSFDIPSADTTEKPADKSDNEADDANKGTEYWLNECEAAGQIIGYDQLAVQNRRDEIKKNVRNTPIAREWCRIDSMFNDAKKNHSLDQKESRIISDLNSLYDRYACSEVKICLGMVFCELKEYKTAAEEFYNGGDYYNAACCAKLDGNDEFALYCLRCMIKTNESCGSNAISALFYLFCKYKRGAECVEAFNKTDISNYDPKCIDTIYYGLILLLMKYDGGFSALGEPNGDRAADIRQIISKIAELSSAEETESLQLTSVASIADYNTADSATSVRKKDKVNEYKGTITKFQNGENNGYGFITSKVEKSLYYNIRQVEDDILRSMLWNGDIDNIKVTFALGVGKNGKKVADHVKACEELSLTTDVCGGMLTSYGDYDKTGNRYGRISGDKNDYVFRDEAVIDPVLTAYFDNTFSANNIYVKFTSKKIKGNRIATKVWMDEVKEKELFEKYRSYTDKKEYDLFLKRKDEIEHITDKTCPFAYSELEPWNESTHAKAQADINDTTSIQKHTPSQKPARYVPGINELLANGTQYLTKEKDLLKAESCFLSVLPLRKLGAFWKNIIII